MAGLMQWFQVTCPSCTAQLQVRLPEGITSVQCSQCKAVFAVQIQPTELDSSAAPMGSKKSRKRKVEKDPNATPRALSAYNVFMKSEVAKVKAQHPELLHREAFKLAAERWQASPMNPQNGGARFPEEATGLDDELPDDDEGEEDEAENGVAPPLRMPSEASAAGAPTGLPPAAPAAPAPAAPATPVAPDAPDAPTPTGVADVAAAAAAAASAAAAAAAAAASVTQLPTQVAATPEPKPE